MIRFILIGLLLVVGCEFKKPNVRVRTRKEKICNKNTVNKRKDFILNCIKNANPKSDEEPEDWIYICENISKNVFCVEKLIHVKQHKYCWDCSWKDQEILGEN